MERGRRPGMSPDTLHALLEQLDARPPYVLVGHSLGGPFIRMFTGLYAEEVAGLVYVDPTDMPTEEDMIALVQATGIAAEEAPRFIEVTRQAGLESFAQIQLPPALRADAEVALELVDTHFADFRGLPPVPDVPVVILMASRFLAAQWGQVPAGFGPRSCEPRACHDAAVRLRMGLLSAQAREVTNGTFVLATDTGHNVQREDPDLVIWAIRRVLEAQP